MREPVIPRRKPATARALLRGAAWRWRTHTQAPAHTRAPALARRPARTRPRGRMHGHLGAMWRDDRGQVAVEFTGMTPAILALLIVLWQAVLVGYSIMLAGNAADQAVHAGAQVEPGESRDAACRTAGREFLPGAWRSGAHISCYATSDLVHAQITIKVPLLFPGFVNMPITVPAKSAAARES